LQNSNQIDLLINQSENKIGKKFIFSLLIILGILGILLYWYFFIYTKEETNKISYIEHTVSTGTIADLLIASGSTSIEKKINLSFSTSGTLSDILITEGDQIEKGQLLAELDSVDLQNSYDRSNLQLKKLLDMPSNENLKNAQYLISQAEKNLNDLLDYPSQEQLKTAEELVLQAQANFISAQENYDELLNPGETKIDSAIKLLDQSNYSISNSNYSISNLNLLIKKSEDTVDSSKILLIESVNKYCSEHNSLPFKGDVCSGVENLPVSKIVTDKILNEIFKCCNANETEMNLSKSFINLNSSHISSIEQINVHKDQLQSHKDQLQSANASLKDAQNTYDDLLNPTQNDIERLTFLEKQAEINLQKRLLSLNEIKLGSNINDINLAKENLEKTKLSLDTLKKGADINDLAIQELLVTQSKENLSKTKLYSPFSGQISSINSNSGEFIGSGQNFLTLSDLDTIEMEIIASEAEYVEIKKGMLGIVILDSKPQAPLVIEVIAISDVPNLQQGVVTYPVRARFVRGFEVITLLSQFAPLLESLSGGMTGGMLEGMIPGGMEGMIPGGMGGRMSGGMGGRMSGGMRGGIDLNNLSSDSPLLNFLSNDLPAEGMNGTVTLLKESVQDVVVIPTDALIVEKSITKVITSIDEGNIRYVEVETGLSDGEKIEIINGLNIGDKIYIESDDELVQLDSTERLMTIDEIQNIGPPGPRGGRPPR
jgi:HlyD family secretion protein